MGRAIKIGTRTSQLALRQVDEVIDSLKKFYSDINPKVVGIVTYGDKDKTTPISDVEGRDFFTKEIDEALLRREIDLAIHSAKDLPDNLNPGLIIAAITKSIDPFDVLASRNNLRLDELKPKARIGTSSLRRKGQLKNYRRDFQIIDIRGDVEERLMLLDEDDLDGIVIAAAGLIRLGLEDRITQRIPFDILKPHPLQGSLAIMVCRDDEEMISLMEKIDSRRKILFICVENACRSQMAEGIFNHLAKGKYKALSAGTSITKQIDPLAIRVMREIKIDIAGQKPKLLDAKNVKDADRVISMGCIDNCPLVKADEDWGIEGPKGMGIEKFRQVRETIYQRVKGLIQRLEE